ncbi:hypothetical protein B0H16DRAFT_1022390 [Mycena metata]|uniref:Uncharacterized protein n=1 Tax=Mycena metata TaxID=1033252 RepID=A0AAD7N2G9_9AGAR|nr:hypothetical protein B0H16DRAFT_1022390 [Mycena metata]
MATPHAQHSIRRKVYASHYTPSNLAKLQSEIGDATGQMCMPCFFFLVLLPFSDTFLLTLASTAYSAFVVAPCPLPFFYSIFFTAHISISPTLNGPPRAHPAGHFVYLPTLCTRHLFARGHPQVGSRGRGSLDYDPTGSVVFCTAPSRRGHGTS